MPDSPNLPLISRFSSRQHRLSHVFLKDRLANARSYRRIAGYFRSSIFELVAEEITAIDKVQIVCNSDLDPRDIAIGQASRLARETNLKEKWNEGADEIESLLHRPRYRHLYELLKSGRVEVRVVSSQDAPFLHGKAGVIEGRDGTSSAFIGSMNETREGSGSSAPSVCAMSKTYTTRKPISTGAGLSLCSAGSSSRWSFAPIIGARIGMPFCPFLT